MVSQFISDSFNFSLWSMKRCKSTLIYFRTQDNTAVNVNTIHLYLRVVDVVVVELLTNVASFVLRSALSGRWSVWIIYTTESLRGTCGL